MLVGVGCNAGRSFITLCLPFVAFASEIAHGSRTSIWDWRPIYLKRGQIELQTESIDMHRNLVYGKVKKENVFQDYQDLYSQVSEV